MKKSPKYYENHKEQAGSWGLVKLWLKIWPTAIHHLEHNIGPAYGHRTHPQGLKCLQNIVKIEVVPAPKTTVVETVL
jgi:hypothetical protein